jgi:hypothetical protein
LYILPLLYMYIFGPLTLRWIQVLFITAPTGINSEGCQHETPPELRRLQEYCSGHTGRKIRDGLLYSATRGIRCYLGSSMAKVSGAYRLGFCNTVYGLPSTGLISTPAWVRAAPTLSILSRPEMICCNHCLKCTPIYLQIPVAYHHNVAMTT